MNRQIPTGCKRFTLLADVCVEMVSAKDARRAMTHMTSPDLATADDAEAVGSPEVLT